MRDRDPEKEANEVPDITSQKKRKNARKKKTRRKKEKGVRVENRGGRKKVVD